MRKNETLPENFGLGLSVALLVSALLLAIISWLFWQIPYPFTLAEYPDHFRYWLVMRINAIAPQFFPATAEHYRLYLSNFGLHNAPWVLTARFDIAGAIGTACGTWIGYITGKGPLAIRHIVGRQLFSGKEGEKKLKRITDLDCKSTGEGLFMHPSFKWRLSRDRETRHFLIIGSIGGGKTQIIISLLKAAINRQDKIIIYDSKGDFTRWLPYLVLMAPWDSRSTAWDIARDCRNMQDARQLAVHLIPEGHDPLWHQSARQVLTGILIKLQADKGVNWTWQDLYELTCSSQETLMQIVGQHLPEARHLLEAPGKTTQSVLINFGSNMSLISDLAAAWGKTPEERRFSIIEWLANDKDKRRMLVLQGSGRYSALARAYIRSTISLMSGYINSPGFSESRNRRLFICLDEFPQLGDLRNEISPILEIGRSKGVRVILGAQDLAQIKAIYGEHTATTWSSMIGTQVIVRINPGDTANFISKEVVGSRTIDCITLHGGKRQPPQRENMRLMEPSELGSDLGPDSLGVRGLMMGFGDAFIVHWPFTQVKNVREASIQAKWLQPPPAAGAGVNDGDGFHPKNQNLASLGMNLENQTADTASQPRLILRPISTSAMANSGTSLSDAAEPLSLLTDITIGGSHESR